MNRKQQNVVEMADVVSAYMAKPENAGIWSGNQAITEAVAELNADLVVIENIVAKQEAPITGPAADKETLRNDLEDTILRIAGQLGALGAKTNNNTLEEQADLTPSAVDKLSTESLTATATRISGLATANIMALAAYNITAADVTALDTLQTQYEAIETKPREAVVARSAETQQLQPVITSLLSLLRRQLDRALLAYKRTNPEFYAGYVAARVIVDRGNPPAPKPPTPPPTP